MMTKAIVLAYGWPQDNSGYGLALKASMNIYQKAFDEIEFVCLSTASAAAWSHPGTVCRGVVVPVQTRLEQFVRSLAGRTPATAIRFRQVRNPVLRILDQAIAAGRSSGMQCCVIIEDTPLTYFLPDVRERHPHIPIALRSHNIAANAFLDFASFGPPYERFAWQLEVNKTRRFEATAVSMVDQLWAITPKEAEGYERIFGRRTDGVVGISLDVQRYANVGAGESCTIVYIGTADLRKGRGLGAFLANVWPRVKEQVPHARLVLAGRGTDRFANDSLDVEGLGFVEDDLTVLSQGAIFVNPQRCGAGIKLKSIVAMLAGKTLVSTCNGVEGVEGIVGEHFFAEDCPQEMANVLSRLLKEAKLRSEVASKSKAMAQRMYSGAHLEHTALPVVENFVRCIQQPRGLASAAA